MKNCNECWYELPSTVSIENIFKNSYIQKGVYYLSFYFFCIYYLYFENVFLYFEDLLKASIKAL